MSKRAGSLKGRMVGSLLLIALPLIGTITVLFMQTISAEQKAEVDKLSTLTKQIGNSVEQVALKSYSASDNLSENDLLLDKVDRNYQDELLKKAAIVQINSQVFEGYNRLVGYKKLDAIYVRGYDEIYDFLDPNQNEEIIRRKIEQLGMNDKDKMGRFWWYPVQQNFLTTNLYGNVRKDKVVIGSRRVFSSLHGAYQYLHIFAVPEQEFFLSYYDDAEREHAQVYILMPDGGLISSTDSEAVMKGQAPEPILNLNRQEQTEDVAIQKYKGQKYYIAKAQTHETGWNVFVIVSQDEIIAATENLYTKVMWMLAVGISLCAFILWQMYRRFVSPLAELDGSMKKVENGDFRAYVTPRGEIEIARMMKRYNKMLEGVQNNTEQQIKNEQRKKELEMQVLTNQINPHFLYNTLETIVWKSNEAGRPDIGRIAASLGKLYRLSIRGNVFVSLQQELDHVKAYIVIQESRYIDKVCHEVKLHNINPMQFQVLKLTLQPLVENCYLHATEQLDRRLKIRIDVRVSKQTIQIRVVDNGIGMDKQTLSQVIRQMRAADCTEQSSRRGSGIGLHNIYARIKLYQAEGDLRILSKKGWGTCLVITLPFKQN